MDSFVLTLCGYYYGKWTEKRTCDSFLAAEVIHLPGKHKLVCKNCIPCNYGS